MGTANINSNSFSIAAWVKPNGIQQSFEQIIGHYGCPGSPNYGIGIGISFAGYTPNLELAYTDDKVTYTNYSGLYLDSARWNYVVLTYAPGGVKLYLNGKAVQVNNSPMPVLDLSQGAFYLNPDIHYQGASFKGLIDEVKIYNYTLSQNEVREKMHLIQQPGANEQGLVKYIQFNQITSSSYVYDIMDGTPVVMLPGADSISTAPVATGTVSRKPLVNAAGLHSFTSADLEMYLPVGGTYPNGEMVAFHLRSNPDQNPDTRSTVPGYFIVNNYGANSSFSTPDSIILAKLHVTNTGYLPGNFRLFQRNAFEFGSTWGAELDSAIRLLYNSPYNSKLIWHGKNGITKGGQIVIVNNKQLPSAITHPKTVFATSSVSELYPNPADEGYFLMDVHALTNGIANISVSDAKGALVHHVTHQLTQGDNKLMISLPVLSQGLYYVRIAVNKEAVETRKLLVE